MWKSAMWRLYNDNEGNIVCPGCLPESANERRERVEEGVESEALLDRRYEAAERNKMEYMNDVHRYVNRLREHTDTWPKGTPRQREAHCHKEGILSPGGSLRNNREAALSRIIREGTDHFQQKARDTGAAANDPEVSALSAARSGDVLWPRVPTQQKISPSEAQPKRCPGLS